MNAARLQPIALLIAAAQLWPGVSQAEDPPPQPPQPPRVLLCAPLGAAPGQTVQIKARGVLLEGVTEVASKTEGVAARFVSQGKVGLPPMLQADRAGDTEVQFELTLAGDVTAAQAELEFVAPHGRATYALPLGDGSPVVAEIEPNPGFRQPQEIALPQLVLGQIAQAHDVDVFAVQLEAQQRVRVEIIAQQYGSAMDPRVTLTDEHGTVLASNDDQPSTRDARIETAVPAAGRYLVVVQDANDLGGDAHPYRLSLSNAPEPLSFVRHIASILQQHCVPCHGARDRDSSRFSLQCLSDAFEPLANLAADQFQRIPYIVGRFTDGIFQRCVTSVE